MGLIFLRTGATCTIFNFSVKTPTLKDELTMKEIGTDNTSRFSFEMETGTLVRPTVL